MKILYIYLILMPFIYACTGDQNVSTMEEHGHSHGAGSVPYTAFSDSCEYFAEIEPMVKGKQSVATIHITRLSTYRPFDEGIMSVNVMINGHKVGSGDTNRPRIPGIFPVTFTATEAGDASLVFSFRSGGMVDSVLVPVAVVYPDEQSASHVPEVEEPAGVIKFTKEMAWKTDFNVLEIRSGEVFNTVKVSGELFLPPTEIETVNATCDGILIYKRNDLVPGTRVEKGSTLFMLTGKGLTTRNMDATMAALQSSFELSRKSYEREKKLVSEQIVSQKQFNETTARYTSDSIRYFSYLVGLHENAMIILSPVSGYVQMSGHPNGAFVTEGTPLMSIVSTRTMMLRAHLPIKHLKEASMIRNASFRTAGNNQVYNVSNLGGRLVAIGSSVAAGNPFIPITFEFPNPSDLVAGSFADVYLYSQPVPGVIAIPETALMEEQGSFYVYVQVGGESFVKRMVTPGFSDGIITTVTTGLTIGERVVTKGAMFIRAATAMTGTPSHGHEH